LTVYFHVGPTRKLSLPSLALLPLSLSLPGHGTPRPAPSSAAPQPDSTATAGLLLGNKAAEHDGARSPKEQQQAATVERQPQGPAAAASSSRVPEAGRDPRFDPHGGYLHASPATVHRSSATTSTAPISAKRVATRLLAETWLTRAGSHWTLQLLAGKGATHMASVCTIESPELGAGRAWRHPPWLRRLLSSTGQRAAALERELRCSPLELGRAACSGPLALELRQQSNAGQLLQGTRLLFLFCRDSIAFYIFCRDLLLSLFYRDPNVF
jgi:hypothetical protein